VKISCPSCTAKYSIADDKVQNRLAKIRCRKCGTTIVIDGKSDPPVVRAADGGTTDEDPAASTAHGYPSLAPGAQAGAASTGQESAGAAQAAGAVYTVDVADNDQRSMTIDQIVAAYNDGTIAADTYVWREGMGDWEPLADVDELNRALHAAAAVTAPQIPATSSPATLSTSAGSVAATGRVSSVGMFGGSAEAARTATRGEVSRDLFGSIDMAGSEYDTRTTSQEAAQAKAATGARNESSVLFSLSALTSGPEPAFRSAPPKNREDSGLIDLAALASLAATNASKDTGGGLLVGDAGGGSLINSPLAAPLGLPPLAIGAAASPLGGLEVPRPANTNRGAMYIGGGIAVAAIVASLAWLLKEDPPATLAVAPAVPALTAPAIPSTPEPSVAAAAEGEGSAKEDEKSAEGEEKSGSSKSASGAAARPRPSKPRPATGGTPAAAKPAAEPASGGGEEKKPAAAPKKKCNCSPSDLMCAMRCSAK
jgi:predicted Zn finger-like uncharacterized protein